MPPLIRNRILVAALALTSACLSVFCGTRLFGELSAMGPVKSMQEWAVDGQMGSHTARQKLLSRLLMSIRVSPWSADRHMDLARFYTWHMHLLPRQSNQHRVFALRTQQQLLDAVRWRPGWGLAWAALAENTVISGQYEPTIIPLLERAYRYAPYEPGTLRKISLMGMLHWENYPQPVRKIILAAVTQSLKIDRHPANLIRLAFSLQWQMNLKPLIETSEQRAEFDRQARRLKS